jgi:hypothetical protein
VHPYIPIVYYSTGAVRRTELSTVIERLRETHRNKILYLARLTKQESTPTGENSHGQLQGVASCGAATTLCLWICPRFVRRRPKPCSTASYFCRKKSAVQAASSDRTVSPRREATRGRRPVTIRKTLARVGCWRQAVLGHLAVKATSLHRDRYIELYAQYALGGAGVTLPGAKP